MKAPNNLFEEFPEIKKRYDALRDHLKKKDLLGKIKFIYF